MKGTQPYPLGPSLRDDILPGIGEAFAFTPLLYLSLPLCVILSLSLLSFLFLCTLPPFFPSFCFFLSRVETPVCWNLKLSH